MKKKIAIFGASGFVGRGLTSRLRAEGFDVLPVFRELTRLLDPYSRTANLQSTEQITKLLVETKTTHVINAVGKAHDLKSTAAQDYEAYRNANVTIAYNIAKAAVSSKKICKLIHLSTSKVYGELGTSDRRSENYKGIGLSLYGQSKLEGERIVLQALKGSNVAPTIIRMPLVYGKGVKGNLYSLYRMINLGLPLPLKGIHKNKRSMLSLKNLNNFIKLVIVSGKSESFIFNLKDKDDYSTADILNHIIVANNMKDRSFAVNHKFLEYLISRYSKTMANKLLFDDMVSDDLARNELSWIPSTLSLDDMKF